MPRTTLLQARNSRISAALGFCSSTQRFVDILNEAQQRLLPLGKWIGTYQRFSIAVTSGLITWPRQIETVEGVDICGSVLPIRNEWFEFTPAGPGVYRDLVSGNNGPRCDYRSQLYDRGTSPLFKDISGTKKLKIYIDNATDAAKTIFFKAKDDNGNKIYSNTGEEGFSVTLANPSVLDAHLVTDVYGVIKAETVGAIRVYQYDPVALTQELIAIYEPDETTPCYRRSMIPGIRTDSYLTIQAIAKLAFIPAKRDTDFLLIESIPALKEMCRSVKMQEDEKYEDAEVSQARAVRVLEKELESYIGDAAQVSIQCPQQDIYNAAVCNPI